MKQLNIKYLAKGMRVEDKAKLMFADRDRRAETQNKEWILTPDEEDALVRDAQELHQINELNKLNRLYNASNFMVLDIQTAYLNFLLAEEKLDGILATIIFVNEGKNKLQRVIRDLAFQGYTDEQLEGKETQNKIDQKAEELRKKYDAESNSINDFDYFSSPLREQSCFSVGTLEDLSVEPNQHLQRHFMETVRRAKEYKRQVYMCRFLSQKAGFELLSDKGIQSMEGFDKVITEFESLESPFSFIKIYSNLADKGLIKPTDLAEPKFMESVKDVTKAINLSEPEQQEAQNEILGLIERHT
jgi:hypothetical protein